MSVPGRAGRGVVGRAERVAVGRAGRVARPAGAETVTDVPGLEPEGDTERSTPSPTSDEFMAGVMQKSPVSSPPNGTTPEDSPGGSPKAPGSPASKIKDLRIKDKFDEELVRVNKVYGTEGTQVSCEVNYVKVMTGERSGPFIYHVRFTPEIESLKVTQDIIRKNPNVVDVIGNVCAFTGMNLYLPKVLPKPITEIEAVHPENPSVSVTVAIEFLKKPKIEELIPFYNTLLRRAMRELQLVQIKHHYFMPNERVGIPIHKLEVWPGYVSKIIELDGGLLLCCEVTHRVLRTSTALEMMRELFRADRNNFKQNALKQLVGCVVLTRYNNKPYRIDDINFNQNALSTFEKADGTVISYKDYLKNSWNETITDDKQPVLIHQPKPRKGETTQRTIVLLPELCFMTGLTDDIRSDFRAMRDIASHTRIPPQIRHAKLLQYLKSLDSNETAKKIFTQWNICLDNKPYEVPARVFPNEIIKFGGGRQVTVNDEVSWTREATSGACYASYHLSDWLIVVPNNEGPKAKEVFECLQQVTRSMGFRIELPTRKMIDNDSAASYVRGIREAVRPTTQLIFILTPGAAQREDRYNAIKKLSCCELAIPSQVVRVATVNDQKKMRSVCQKVALQMQCKIGGQPWIVQIPFKTAMFVGIDVYHDPNRQSKSCVAIVASMNPECSQWFSRVFFQGTSEEIAETIGNGLAQCAKKFADKVGVIPDRVFVYRDGVGDGQIPVVQSYEVPQMKNALCSVDKSGQVKPKLSCIVVQKRIDTRMILRAGQSFGNPKSGTVLDRGVTRVNYTDFFLISQHVTQGTVTPTHYIITKDEVGLTPDKMQRLTYRMTFLYYNWTGCVRVPAQCQYAHKIAYLAGQNLFAPPKDSICDKLFFL